MFLPRRIAHPLRAVVLHILCLGVFAAAGTSSVAVAAGSHRSAGCPVVAYAASQAHAVRHRRMCAFRVRNPFGAGMFGIATGSTLQNEVATPTVLSRDLGDDRAVGARWIRIDINWAQIQYAGPHSYAWQDIDAAVRRARAMGMSVLGTIVFTPSWARPRGTVASWGPRPTAYGNFAGIAAAHYAALGVHTFEIWNEENISGGWTPRPDPVRYAQVLRRAYAAIKHAAPGSVVMTGGTAPALNGGGNLTPVRFLAKIYAHGAHGYFDAVANHPYCWPAYPGAKGAWSAWYQMYGTHPSMRSLMIAHGDGAKRIWATEFGAPTDGPTGTYVSQRTQARMVTSAYRLFATYRWAGPMFYYSSRDLGASLNTRENFFGFISHNFTRKPSFSAYHRIAMSVRSALAVAPAP